MIWMQTRSGRALDLIEPDMAALDIRQDVAVPLALIKRFGAHSGDARHGFSVAQHSILGARVLLAETGDASDIALAFLLHDAHEAFIGDIASPVAQALDRLAWPVDSEAVTAALRKLKTRLDAAIHKRLGLDWPRPIRIDAYVKDMDVRMLKAERTHTMAPPPRPWHRSVEAAEPILSLDWRDFLPMKPEDAADAWMAMLAELMPGAIPEMRADG